MIALTLIVAAATAAAGRRGVPDGTIEKPSVAERERYALVDVTAPVTLDEPALDHVLSVRRGLGISSDPEFVRSLFADPAAFSAVRSERLLFGGQLVAPEELRVVELRADVEAQAPDANARAKEMLGAQYAGSYLDGPYLTVRCVGCDPESVRQSLVIDGNWPSPVAEQTRVETATYSVSQLTDLHLRVEAYLEEAGFPWNGSSPSISTNQVEVYLGPSSPPELEAQLASQFRSEPVAIIREPRDLQPAVWKDDYLIFGIVEGGQAVKEQGSGSHFNCTSGFSVYSAFGDFIALAGHCILELGGLNEEWRQGNATLGYSAAAQDSGGLDAGLISTTGYRTAVGRYHNTSTDYFVPVWQTLPVIDDLEGLSICQTGATTTFLSGDLNFFTRCGEVKNTRADPGPNHTNWYIKTDQYCDEGDSRAANIWPAAGFTDQAAGIMSRCVVPFGPSWSTRMDKLLFDWGLGLKAP